MELGQFDEFEAAVERRTEEEAGELAGGVRHAERRSETGRNAAPDRQAGSSGMRFIPAAIAEQPAARASRAADGTHRALQVLGALISMRGTFAARGAEIGRYWTRPGGPAWPGTSSAIADRPPTAQPDDFAAAERHWPVDPRTLALIEASRPPSTGKIRAVYPARAVRAQKQDRGRDIGAPSLRGRPARCRRRREDRRRSAGIP